MRWLMVSTTQCKLFGHVGCVNSYSGQVCLICFQLSINIELLCEKAAGNTIVKSLK